MAQKKNNYLLIYGYIQKNTGCKSGEIAKYLGIPRRTVGYTLGKMVRNGEIIREGEAKSQTHYFINKEANNLKALKVKLTEVNLNPIIVDRLKNYDIHTVEDLVALEQSDLSKIYYLGKKGARQIVEFVEKQGLSFKKKPMTPTAKQTPYGKLEEDSKKLSISNPKYIELIKEVIEIKTSNIVNMAAAIISVCIQKGADSASKEEIKEFYADDDNFEECFKEVSIYLVKHSHKGIEETVTYSLNLTRRLFSGDICSGYGLIRAIEKGDYL